MTHYARGLIDDETFTAVVKTVQGNNPEMAQEMCERIVTEALKFVATGAEHPNAGIAPSRVVDEGWHALILHTKAYTKLCDGLGGYVHHQPQQPDPDRYDPTVITRTTTLMATAGYAPDLELWGSPTEGLALAVAADCQHSPNCEVTCMNP
ncbi:glycine-rich domain-containing protein [Actinacidiphila oryziradicis]|uniref:Uncharacterized protein n=1 Tax=Actinacidiphila oryziradicis TaxID=2571141 RepID=A0A4U0STB7_9ACTN|nr:hypothetical protein [Actinacidiphila oryziradicis]TKA11387.1 hypothetical protein FCI23_11110 [Actinacidiphila oryziradicis]